MKSSMLVIAAVACATALPASAQVLGGNVSVGAGAQVGLPSTQPLTGAAGQTIRDAARTVQDTTTDVGATAREGVDATVNAQVTTSGAVQADPGQASADLEVSTGAMAHGADGAMLGAVVGTTRDAAGRVQGFMVRSADGAVKAIPAAGARVQGDVLVTGWSEAQFKAAPAAD